MNEYDPPFGVKHQKFSISENYLFGALTVRKTFAPREGYEIFGFPVLDSREFNAALIIDL